MGMTRFIVRLNCDSPAFGDTAGVVQFSEVARILREIATRWDRQSLANNARMDLTDKDGLPVGKAGFTPD